MAPHANSLKTYCPTDVTLIFYQSHSRTHILILSSERYFQFFVNEVLLHIPGTVVTTAMEVEII